IPPVPHHCNDKPHGGYSLPLLPFPSGTHSLSSFLSSCVFLELGFDKGTAKLLIICKTAFREVGKGSAPGGQTQAQALPGFPPEANRPGIIEINNRNV